ncbi:MAG: hypothetical protein Q9195_001395 [Heterodermia aff. obscurata]
MSKLRGTSKVDNGTVIPQLKCSLQVASEALIPAVNLKVEIANGLATLQRTTTYQKLYSPHCASVSPTLNLNASIKVFIELFKTLVKSQTDHRDQWDLPLLALDLTYTTATSSASMAADNGPKQLSNIVVASRRSKGWDLIVGPKDCQVLGTPVDADSLPPPSLSLGTGIANRMCNLYQEVFLNIYHEGHPDT